MLEKSQKNLKMNELARQKSIIIIIIMEICKAPTLRLKALDKHTHTRYIEMENVIKKTHTRIYRQVFKHNHAKDA